MLNYVIEKWGYIHYNRNRIDWQNRVYISIQLIVCINIFKYSKVKKSIGRKYYVLYTKTYTLHTLFWMQTL